MYTTQSGLMSIYVSTAAQVTTSPRSKTFTHSVQLVATEKSSRGGSNYYQLVVSGLCAFVIFRFSQEEM